MSENEQIAGPGEELISASACHKVYRLLAQEGEVAGTLIGASAVISGALDGLARYICAVQITNDTPEQIVDVLAPHLLRFIELRSQRPQGDA